MKYVRSLLLACVLLLMAMPISRAQNLVPATRAAEEVPLQQIFTFDFPQAGLHFRTDTDGYTTMLLEGTNYHTTTIGAPLLPTLRQMIALPEDDEEYVVDILVDDTIVQHRPNTDLTPTLRPVSPPHIKGDPDTGGVVPMDTTLASATEVATLTPLGHMRHRRWALLTIAPLQYRSGAQSFVLHSHIQVCIHAAGTPCGSAAKGSARLSQPSELYQTLLPSYAAPPVYVVVSVDTFLTALQPFIQWKRQQGFLVETLSAPAWQRDTLRAQLKRRYLYASPLQPPPTYILLVGDHAHIPAQIGTESLSLLGTHATDLYYAEYTGDQLPESMVGRFSVRTIAQLNAVVEKTLAYEKYALVDTQYLSQALLVAGYEQRQNIDTLTNGQVNYLKQAFLHADSTLDTHCFYNPASDGQRSDILAVWQQGVGSINYTAHCLTSGWHHPQIFMEDVDSLPADDKYFFIINNCCNSNDFSTECFGEALLRKPHGGAIGVLGATGQTIWDEDYIWALGAKQTYTLAPAYDSTHLGAYDRLLHSHGEPRAQHATTLGEMLLAGNCAVTLSGSSFAGFYWEAYCLLGDPSLMPYVGIPRGMTITISDTGGRTAICSNTLSQDTLSTPRFEKGTQIFHFHGPAHAYVALLQDTMLVGACLLDSTGNGIMALRAAFCADSLTLTATAFGYKPLITTLYAGIPLEAQVVATEVQLCNNRQEPISYIATGDTVQVVVTWKNIGGEAASRPLLEIAPAEDSAVVLLYGIASPEVLAKDSSIQVAYPFVVSPLWAADTLRLHAVSTLVQERDTHRWAMPLLVAVQQSRLAIHEVVLMLVDTAAKGITSAREVLPHHNYFLQIVLSNTGRFPAHTSRLSIAQCTGATLTGNSLFQDFTLMPEESSTLFIPLTTHDTLAYLSFEVELSWDNHTEQYPLTYLPFETTEQFQSGDFSRFPWDTAFANPWVIDSTESHTGAYSARSATIGHNRQSRLSITLQVNATDTLVFWVKTSSEARADYLHFLVNDVERGRWSGQTDWEQQQYILRPGTQTLTWYYEKDATLSEGRDGAWVDDIRFPFSVYSGRYPAGAGPVVEISPAEEALGEVLFWPNPAREGIILQNNLPTEAAVITFYDTYGRAWHRMHLPSHATTHLTTATWPRGVYLVQIQHNRIMETKQLIIAR